MAGLPLTSAPVSVFLAVEQGPPFAAKAAIGTLWGVIAMSAFCVGYARIAARASWRLSAPIALALCLSITAIASFLPQEPAVAALITFPALLFLAWFVGRAPESREPKGITPWWDIPARMVVATAIVLLITGAATFLGATWSGLLSTLPVYALVMGAFSHAHGGAAAAQFFLRGVAVGALGAAMFLFVVANQVESASLIVTYCSASVASIGLAAVSQAIFLRVARP